MHKVLIFCLCAAVVWPSARTLANRNPSDVRLLFYLFSLSSTVTILVVWWAVGAGAIDADGAYQGFAGEILEKAYRTMTNLGGEMKLLGALAALVIVPQFLAYLLSGLFGCAGEFFLLSLTTRFIFWSAVKFLAVAAGISTVLVVCVQAMDWHGRPAEVRFFVPLLVSGLMLNIAFIALVGYRMLEAELDSDQAKETPEPRTPGWLRRSLQSVHRCASRNSPKCPKNGTQFTVTIPDEVIEKALSVAAPGWDKADIVREAIETFVRVKVN